MGNRVASLEALLPLAQSPRLTRLYLINNPVAALPHYRAYVAAAIPSLRVLDFQKVTATEREEGRQRFGDGLREPPSAVSTLNAREKLRLLIEKSTSLEELRRLEVLLRVGGVGEEALDARLREMGLL